MGRRISRISHAALFAVFFIGVSIGVYADTIILKDGSKYKGAILSEDRHEVEAIIDIGLVRFLKSDIAQIDKGSMWENNAYLKKAQDFGYKEKPQAVQKSAPQAIEKQKAAAPESPREETSTDYVLRQRDMELRQQEIELKRLELEMMREELKIRREEMEAGISRPGRRQEPESYEYEEDDEAPKKEEKTLYEEVVTPAAQEGVGPEGLSQDENIRSIVIEEQQKEQERKERLESYRRLQEIRQKQEGITIRGRVNPAGNERYQTY